VFEVGQGAPGVSTREARHEDKRGNPLKEGKPREWEERSGKEKSRRETRGLGETKGGLVILDTDIGTTSNMRRQEEQRSRS
jgi:hypothetical protein